MLNVLVYTYNMQYTDITAYAREQTGKSNSWNFSDANLLKYVNTRYHIIENEIKDLVAEDYFFNIYRSDLVEWQNEYSLKWSASDEEWISKIVSVSAKRSDDDEYYTKLSENIVEWYSTDYLQSNISTWQWFYEIKDSSIFIYPKAPNSVFWWLEARAIITNPDLTTTSIESNIFPRHSELRHYHYIIALWLIADILWIDWKDNEKNIAESKFEREILRMCKALWWRKHTAVTQNLPNLDFYKY